MSFASEEEIDCPCGETFLARQWNSVNLKEDPDLRSILMGGELNVVPCSLCKNLVYTERFVLVHDPENELIAFVHPKARAGEKELLEAAMHRDMAQAQSVPGGLPIPYPPELLFGMESVVDILSAEQESADQSAILDALAPSVPVEVLRLPPAQARAAGLPRSTPLSGEGSPVDRLSRGLRAVLAANDRLTVYKELLDKVEGGGLSQDAAARIAG
jgi:hypothetical protein